MEINDIKYLLTVVNNDFNLTQSAKVLHVSQPAISKAIKDVEFKRGTKIFNRKKGRLIGLTRYGRTLIEEAKKVYSQYSLMITKLNELSEGINGTVRIGIAPVIISTVFNDALIAFINENPGIQLKLLERGAYELQRMLNLGDIDLAVIVSPATVEGIYEDLIYENTVRVWFNKDHRFNDFEGPIPFTEVEQEKIVTLTDDFMVTFQLNKKLKGDRIKPDYFLQTSSWDLILNLVQRDPNLIGILATPIGKNYSDHQIMNREMTPSFPWRISLCHTMNSIGSSIVDYTKDWFLKYFSKYKKISINN
ncbi:LysR family transcriptional regulator [Lactobacillus acetotolerans]|uniref:LysR family transcriptional regulator n=1 Tax=Lactobacillus acetotolerans TaxID=1600 RepID=UPI001451F9F8|nr:LysR family transcriptional regulator [Lactobacillus acetotolerans]QJD72607.1 LysR family transcriptional regulator [Lactobacillus acetotolerans]